ncbi:MAG: gliding motility-associated C-terminal domain-containing protein [Bacteroidota bacterium]|nr:gliding motility-associated C-terminal domain-containing protein [Bacteroidota bacterium]
MQEKDQISELFKDTFSNYEVPVRPELWQNVASKIQSPAVPSIPDGSTVSNLATASSKLTGSLLTWVSVATVAVSIATGVYFYTNRDSVIANEYVPTPVSQVSPSVQTPFTSERIITTSTPTLNTQVNGAEKSVRANADNKVASGSVGNLSTSEKPGAFAPVSDPTLTQVATIQTDASQMNREANSGITEKPVVKENAAKPKIQALPATGYAPLTVDFNASIGDENNEWHFGDGTEAKTGVVASHIYQKPGTYLVTYKNTDATGKIHTELITIEVYSDLTVTGVPNIFTPNGDGTNDLFTINAAQDIDIEVSIFDHNGKFIHRFKGAENSWNGKINNIQDAGEGTYFYVIFATGKNGEKNTQKGTITLKR